MEAFFYIPKNRESDVLNLGLRLREWGNRTVNVSGTGKLYIAMLLNPKDDLLKYNDNNYVPLKIDVNPNETFVADGAIYRDDGYNNLNNNSGEEDEVVDLYARSMTLLNKYIFGTFRMPECLIPKSILSEEISVLDKRIDVPVLYNSSEEFYLEHEIERCNQTYDNFLDKLLYHYYEHMVSIGMANRYYSNDNDIVIYESLVDGKVVTVRKG